MSDAASVPNPPGGVDALVALAERWRLVVGLPLLAGLVALGVSFVVPMTFTARTTILPPQTQQGAGSAALASLSALSALSGASMRTPADQYASLMETEAVRNRVIEQLGLVQAYKVEYPEDARRELNEAVRIVVGKKDGLITVEADDKDPKRAAAIANAHVEHLRALAAELSLSEAQQRRQFFERQVRQTSQALAKAQAALQGSGFSAAALRAEPKSTAEGYARLRAELTAAEVRLQALRSALTENAPEISAQLAQIGALRRQLATLEAAQPTAADQDYIGRYREFKYQESLYEIFLRQYELARLDESRDGGMIQVIDTATPPQRKSRPKRAMVAVTTTLVTGLLVVLWVGLRAAWARAGRDPANAEALARWRRLTSRAAQAPTS